MFASSSFLNGTLTLGACGWLLLHAPCSALGTSPQNPEPLAIERHVPAAPLELVALQAFSVREPMKFWHNGKQEKISRGFIAVLKVERQWLRPVNEPDHLLLLGNSIGQRVNVGFEDGHLIVVTPQIDWLKTPVYFGSRLVPERLQSEDLEREWQLAREARLPPFTVKEIAKAQSQHRTVLHARDVNQLWFKTKPWILRYAPSERDMAESLVGE
jgi:hypothetical protein